MGGAWIMSKHIPDDKSWSDLRNIHELRGKRLVAQVSQTRRSALYSRTGVVLILRLESSWHGRCFAHVSAYSRRQIAVGSQKPSRITRQNTRCANLRNHHDLRGKRLVAEVSQTRRFALYSRTGGVLMLRLESSWHGRSVDRVLTYFGPQIAVGSQKPSRITRQKTCCASESNTSVHVVFANRSGFDAPIGVVLAWVERGSCLNIFRTTNHGRISENLHELRGKRLVAQVSQTRRFANGSGFDAPIGVVLAWEERGSSLNIFRTTNRGRISETFTNYEAKESLRKNLHELRGKRLVAPVSQTRRFANGSGFDAPIGVVLAWEERGSFLNIFRMKNHDRISETFTNYEAKDLLRKNLHELRGKTIAAHVSRTRRFANRSGFDAPIGVVLAWEDRRSCLNIFRTTNRGQNSETFTNYEPKDLLRNESNTSVRVVFPNMSGFDNPIGVVLAWEERGSCLNIIRTTNRGQISETFKNYEAKDLLRK
ncbi:uncharacterized protein G2W53_009820 [Senna tora]|uniref:Uncharacterized protein n=1 Tax=Senna tora TaxID=362788 RepID=A0A835CAK7_9FABA|nr:uncharacterized protein G2W53_009820 [Senna tora]